MPHPNIITLSWVANVCSDPPTVAIGVRPNRHSHKLLLDAGEFVLNVPQRSMMNAVVFCGTKSGRDYDKFSECHLTATEAIHVGSPMIQECPINIECKTRQVVSLGAHDLFIAEVLGVHVDESILGEDGRVDLSRLEAITHIPLSGQYWSLGDLIPT